MGAVGYVRRDLHIVIGCPSTQCGEGVVLAKPGRIGGVAAVSRAAGVEAEERHGGRNPAVGGGVVVFMRRSK